MEAVSRLPAASEPLSTTGAQVDSGFFRLLGTKPLLGRVFTDEEDRAGATRTVVLDHRFWLAKLGSDPNVLGSTLDLNGMPYR